MKLFRRLRLVVIPACFCVISIGPALSPQQPPASQPPAQPQTQTPPATPPKPSPFETIPAEQQPAPAPAPPAAPVPPPAAQQAPSPQLETPKQEAAPAVNPNGQVVEAFEFRGAKRVPQDTLKALIVSKPGDIYNEETLKRDFMILWNTGRFDDIRLEAEPGRLGLIVRFVVTERRVIRSIEYPGAVLIVDDEAAIRESLQTLLEFEGYAVEVANDGHEGLARIAERPFDLVLLDFALPERNGIEVLHDIRERDSDLPVIMITAYGTVENAVNAMQAGATNFIQKPWDNEKLLADVRTAVGRRRAEEEVIQLKRALKQRYNFENIIGKSEPMLRIFDLVAQVAPSRSTVLLQGESGTGKELIAKAVHMSSPRKDRAFVPVNTGSMPTDLLESTLFGHVKGAFTSAIASKKGLFEVADRGTLFLDEIGTMNLETQAKILRVLQDRKFMHLGGVSEIQVDVRIIAATNVNLQQQVKDGKFRDDLFYRLNVITIDLPPLRQRKNDIPMLVAYFIAKFAEENERLPLRTTPEAMRPLLEYD